MSFILYTVHEIVVPYKPPRILRLCSGKYLQVIKPKRLYGQRSFKHLGAILWNDLPDHIKSADSISSFKTKLKTHMFVKAYGDKL